MRRVLEKQGARTVLEPAGIMLDEIVKAHRWGMARVQPTSDDRIDSSFRWAPAVRVWCELGSPTAWHAAWYRGGPCSICWLACRAWLTGGQGQGTWLAREQCKRFKH